MQLDSLEFLAEQGGAPVHRLGLEGSGAGRTPPLSADSDSPSPLSSNSWSALLRHYLDAPFEPGHDIRPLQNGAEIFPAMLESIRSARHSVEFLFFIFSNGDTAERFCQALIERARAGVAVRVLLDAFGRKSLGNALIDRLERSAVELRVYHPVTSWKLWKTPSRNHRKILVVDSRVAYTGGVGIDDHWAGRGNDPDHYRDTQFRLTGPAVGRLKAAFFDNWANAGGRLPDPLDPIPGGEPQAGGSRAGVVASSTASHDTPMALMFQLLARAASRSIQIITPYFVPGETLLEELCRAAERGVDIQLLVSGRHADHRLPLWAGRGAYESLLQSGVRIEEYDRTLMHSKLVIVDERVVMFGSPNMNQRSQRFDEELAIVCHDPRLAKELLGDIDQDRRHCRQIDLEGWQRRSLWMRAAEKLAALFGPQL